MIKKLVLTSMVLAVAVGTVAIGRYPRKRSKSIVRVSRPADAVSVLPLADIKTDMLIPAGSAARADYDDLDAGLREQAPKLLQYLQKKNCENVAVLKFLVDRGDGKATDNAGPLNAGVADRLGSIEKGKIANLVVTDGDLFEDKTTVKRVFVEGRAVAIQSR